MDDTKPRHEAFSYASAGDPTGPSEEFPILYRLLTAERKPNTNNSTKRHYDNNNNHANYQLNISANHSYFPIICRNSRNNRKNKTHQKHPEKESLTLSKVEADSTSDISLTHILARNKYNIQPPIYPTIGRKTGAKRTAASSGRNNNNNKGKKGLKNIKDVTTNDDEMMPSSTTNDDEDIDEYLEHYYYSRNGSNCPPPRKRTRFPQSMKRALILRRSLLRDREDINEDNSEMDKPNGHPNEENESLLVSTLSVNERLAVLLGQQQQHEQVQSVNENNNSLETKPPSLVPQAPAINNIFCNNTQSNHSRPCDDRLEVRPGEGALRTLLSRPPTSLSPSSRKLVFPPHPVPPSLPNESLSPPAAFPTNLASQEDDDGQKKNLIKDVVEQLRAAASQRLNSLFSCKRSLNKANNDFAVIAEEKSLHKCPQCDLTFKRFYHLSRHLAVLHADPEKLLCSFCSQEFETKDQLQNHVQSCIQSCSTVVAKQSSSSSSSSPINYPKEYIGLSELLETKVEDSPPPPSAFHSFVLPAAKYSK